MMAAIRRAADAYARAAAVAAAEAAAATPSPRAVESGAAPRRTPAARAPRPGPPAAPPVSTGARARTDAARSTLPARPAEAPEAPLAFEADALGLPTSILTGDAGAVLELDARTPAAAAREPGGGLARRGLLGSASPLAALVLAEALAPPVSLRAERDR